MSFLRRLIGERGALRLVKNDSWTRKNILRWTHSSRHLEALIDIVGRENALTDGLESFNSDWLGIHQGDSKLVLTPKTTADVSKILQYCDRTRVKCVVQSGNTSLVAGAVPAKDEVIISMKKMNQILAFDDNSGVLECQAGCVLENLEEYVAKHQRLIPYDLGAKGSCLIGGNAATNAGGLRFVKYGPLHGNILGLEVVLPNGKVLDLMSNMRKDNTGYHLKHLFIGSEGTLGVITKVAILCPIDYREKIVILAGLESFDHVLSVYRSIQGEFGEFISCFEMFDSISLDAVVKNLERPIPLDKIYPFHVMFELSTNDGAYLERRVLTTLEKMNDQRMIENATYSLDSNRKNFLNIKAYRELISEALKRDGHCYKYDISLPLDVYYEAVDVLRARLVEGDAHTTRVCGYGHVGDSNLHLNVTSPRFDANIQRLIEPFIYEYVAKHRGSISAEHGIGHKKRDVLCFSKSAQAIELMKQIKDLIDPNGTLNPEKVF